MKKKARMNSEAKRQVMIQIAVYAASFFLFVSGLIAGIRVGQPIGGLMVLGAVTMAILNTAWLTLRFLRSGRKKADRKLVIRSAIQIALYVAAFFTFFLGLGVGLAVNPLIGTILVLGAFAIAGLNTVWLVMWLVKTGKK